MVVPESQDKMYYPPDDMKRDAHVPDFNSYLALYRKSLENPDGRSSMYVVLVRCLQFFLALSFPPSPVCKQSVFICSVCSLWHQVSLCFQLSGKRLLMNSFGRSQQQDQWCSTTLMWQKGTYMSNAWKGPKPTCAIMFWTGLWGRGILVKKLPITGKQ